MPEETRDVFDHAEEAVTYSPSKVSWGMSEFVSGRPRDAAGYLVRGLTIGFLAFVLYAAFFEVPVTLELRGEVVSVEAGPSSRVEGLFFLSSAETLRVSPGMKAVVRFEGVPERVIPPLSGSLEAISDRPLSDGPVFTAKIVSVAGPGDSFLAESRKVRVGMPLRGIVILGHRTPLAGFLSEMFNVEEFRP